MMKNNVEKLKMATNNYRLKDDYQLTEKVLDYIKQRISANQNEIEELIKLKKEKVTYEKIEKAINTEIDKDIAYKSYDKILVSEENFISTSLLMPVGIVAVETYETIEVVKYLIRAIKTRNAIAISDAEYDEQSTKFLILEIIKEALKKFDIDENLIMILPYEECFYDYFDKVIYTYNKSGQKLRQNGYEKKKYTDKKYIYIENKELEEIALKDNQEIEKEILTGSLEEAIQKINQEYGFVSCIYTKNPDCAYQFINLVNSKNIFVNTSLQNAKETAESQYELLDYRNIILPITKDKKDIMKKAEDEIKEEKSLQIVNQSIFSKIKELFKKYCKH